MSELVNQKLYLLGVRGEVYEGNEVKIFDFKDLTTEDRRQGQLGITYVFTHRLPTCLPSLPLPTPALSTPPASPFKMTPGFKFYLSCFLPSNEYWVFYSKTDRRKQSLGILFS